MTSTIQNVPQNGQAKLQRDKNKQKINYSIPNTISESGELDQKTKLYQDGT